MTIQPSKTVTQCSSTERAEQNDVPFTVRPGHNHLASVDSPKVCSKKGDGEKDDDLLGWALSNLLFSSMDF